MTGNPKITHIFCRNSKQAVEALDRLTGLNWGKMPKSLVNGVEEEEPDLSEPDLTIVKIAQAGRL